MNLILSLFLLTISVLLIFHYYKYSETILSGFKPKQRHIQEKFVKRKIAVLFGFILLLITIVYFIVNIQFQKIEYQNDELHSRIMNVVTNGSSIQINKQLVVDSLRRDNFAHIEKNIKKQEHYNFIGILILIISVLTFILSFLLNKRKFVYISAATGIIASTISLLTQSQLIKATLTLKPDIEFSPEVNINILNDTNKIANYTYDTLIVNTFESGFDTLQKNNNLESVTYFLNNSTHNYDIIELTGMVDQRSLGLTSRKIFETNKNLGKARARFVQKNIERKVRFLSKPKFDLRTSEPNDFTTSLDTNILATNRIVIIVCRYKKDE
jgi:hypothetical protein